MKQINIVNAYRKPVARLLLVCLLLISLASCRKKEFMPEIEGKPVPHQDITLTLKEALATSPNSLFKAAWERSNMDKILKTQPNKTNVTLLVPADAAFIAEGMTLEVIKNTKPELLDSLLSYHVVLGALDPADFKTRKDNFMMHTLLPNKFLRLLPTSSNQRYEAYFYRQYLKMNGSELFINGKTAGQGIPVLAKDGTLWPVNRILHKPTKSILRTLQDDGRFGIYLQLSEVMDAMWLEASQGMGEQHDFREGLMIREDRWGESPNIAFISMFAPTDEAFHKAGFHSIDDLLKFNRRNPEPYFDWDTYTMVGSGYATDTLMAFTRWGKMMSYTDPSSGRGQDNVTTFYSNDLNNTLLGDYTLVNSGLSGTLPVFKMPFDFSTEGGKVKIKVKGSPYPAATVTEGDINTLMGPIHVIDALIPPKEFKY